MTEPVALFTQTDYDAERWTALMLLWGLGEVTLTTDDAGMFVVDFDSAESADRTWKGKGPEECLAEVIESFTSEHWDFDALPRVHPAPAPADMVDPYVGAREDLEDWKRRALVAERDCRYLTQELQKEVSGHTFMGEPVLTKPAEHPLFGKMEPLGQPFEKVLSDNLDALQEAEHTTEAPAGVPDVDGLQRYAINCKLGAYEKSDTGFWVKHRDVAPALAALQSQVLDLKGSLDTSRLCTHERDRKIAQQAERITTLERENAEFRNQLVELDHCRDVASNAEEYERERDVLKAKLAEAVGLLEDAVSNYTPDTSRGMSWRMKRSAFLNKAREVTG